MFWALVLLRIFLSDAIAAEQKTISHSRPTAPTIYGSTLPKSTLPNIYRSPNGNTLPVSLLAAGSSHSIDEEAALLLSFKASITGDPMGALETWNNGSSPCNWQGILCSLDGFVSDVNLTALALSGTLSPSLLLLPHLKSLDLSNNFLTGPLPLSFGNLSSCHNLTILNLINNSFSGSIPRELGNCTSLTSVALHFNSLTGPIPSELSSLSKLQTLTLSYNNLNGSLPIPILINCTKLITLALSINAFTGPLPAQIGKLKRLQYLWLDHNSFSGKLPPELGNLTRLMLLQLDNNNLTGSIPPSLGQLTSLTILLSLSMNRLSGPIPPQLGNLHNLSIMTLMGNSLNGTIPKKLGNMQAVQGLFLEDNMLEGTIPAELANCTNLEQLRLDSNGLTGTIPDGLGSLQHLTMLYLHDNKLQGFIPTSLTGLARLQDLSLGFNDLSGPIPPLLVSLSTIVFNFSMPHNSLNGTIPSGFGLMINVQNIDLSANHISGSIPVDIGNCVNLMQLNLSFNSLTGEIPQTFQSLVSLQILDVSNNSLSGGIPSLLANLTQLQHINLSYNNLTGPIPTLGVFAKMNASSFLGNPGLCGPPLTVICPSAPLTLPPPPETGDLKVGFMVLIAIACLVFALVLFPLLLAFLRRKNSALLHNDTLNESVSEYSKHLRRFTAKELKVATEDFSEARIIGTGGMSKVYRATNVIVRLAPQFRQVDVAVKVLSVDHNPSFSKELEALGSIRHRNLVKLYGFCDSGNLQAFVLELLPNGSLQDQLYNASATPLSISTRFHIALDVANGLAYLHHGLKKTIVHRDVKPSNILFDQEMVAKVADFGIAKLLDEDEVHSKAKGTPGYVAPEYGESTRVDTKGDVYSFGVVMLEMLTRKEPTDAMFGSMGVSLPMWVRSAYPERTSEILDPQLRECREHGEDEAIKAMLELALRCTEIKADDRPDMEAVVTKLTSIDSFLAKASTHHHEEAAFWKD